MVDSNLPAPRAQQSSRGMATGEVTLPLLTAFQRLIDLLAEPKDILILAPIIKRALQYQKWLRLNEARRLMLSERLDATTPAFQVGYESPSQFSREYSRLFCNSLLRDITNLRQTTVAEVA